MPVRETEAIILRSYPLKEADKIVSFLARSGGKTRGVAPNARRSVRRFGAGLELLSHVRLRYQEREAQDLVRLESCELLDSFFDAQSDYAVAVAFGHVAEVAEQLLPEREANDAFFRLILLVIEEIRRTGEIWRPLTYFDLWAVHLAGFLPPLDACLRCGAALEPDEPAWFRASSEGLRCRVCRTEGSSTLASESRALARRMRTASLATIPAEGWNKRRAADLRRFLGTEIERHIERRLVTRKQLEELDIG
jgi:DNA repair protein RecO (recombination protein O)